MKPGILKTTAICVAMAFSSAPAFADVGGDMGSDYRVGGRWAAMSGASLQETLNSWSRQAGWTLDWTSESDYRLRTSITFNGSFQDAVTNLLNGIYRQHPEINATLNRPSKVLVVQESIMSN